MIMDTRGGETQDTENTDLTIMYITYNYVIII